MELLMSVVIGLMFAVSIYLMLSRNMLRVILGTALISHAINLMLMTVGLLKRGAAPFLGEEHVGAIVDPIPQALILTAIVIGFGVTAFLLVMAYRGYQELGSDDFNELRGVENE
ncbi:monovalent cation/H+ antiporter subunit C [Clostridiales bacterium PH28_bin88]|nr:monovalent cation/H+ antiporter subunit C [Clostridiales bacterium PH28_bin88]